MYYRVICPVNFELQLKNKIKINLHKLRSGIIYSQLEISSPRQITNLSSRHVKVIYLSLALKIRRPLNGTRFRRRRWPVKVSQDAVVTHFGYNSP